ncbi:hypothetical protein E2C01_094859 [Portunus trituberculatus]|uniref:Uncharacterized protein n=1 Tax=Portunus trituberculatus TaxID=210409 RepID=A0A5B7JYS0_PORTR|nr:hypothetical protein [Portunus trituberculatus]
MKKKNLKERITNERWRKIDVEVMKGEGVEKKEEEEEEEEEKGGRIILHEGETGGCSVQDG